MMDQALMTYADRRDAGRQLAARLQDRAEDKPVILALPRGGVPIAYEVAKALGAQLDLLMVRKIGAPGWPEHGIGAVIGGAEPHLVLDEDIVRQVAPSPNYIQAEKRRQLREMDRRRMIYLGSRRPIGLAGRNVIIVDDGIATGVTMKAALLGIRKSAPHKVTIAVPVAAPTSLKSLEGYCDEIICLQAPPDFTAVGNHYQDFRQTSDSEVIKLMAALT